MDSDTLMALWVALGFILMGGIFIAVSLRSHDAALSEAAWMVGGLNIVCGWMLFCSWLGRAFIGECAILLCIAPLLAAGFASVIWPDRGYPGDIFE